MTGSSLLVTCTMQQGHALGLNEACFGYETFVNRTYLGLCLLSSRDTEVLDMYITLRMANEHGNFKKPVDPAIGP